MKTAEEWLNEIPTDWVEYGEDEVKIGVPTEEWIQQIQLDAMKEGYERAACIGEDASAKDLSPMTEILSAAEQLTLKDIT